MLSKAQTQIAGPTNSNGLPVRPWMELEPPAMTAANRRSALVTLRWATLGMRMASLLMTPACREADRLLPDDSGSRYRTCFCRRGCCFGWRLCKTPARISSSRVSVSRWRSGSSSASCSPMSPVSIQEEPSEPSSSDAEYSGSSAGWPWPCGVSSQDECSRSCRGWRSWWRSWWVEKVRRGILEGRRVGFGAAILSRRGLFGSSPRPRRVQVHDGGWGRGSGGVAVGCCRGAGTGALSEVGGIRE